MIGKLHRLFDPAYFFRPRQIGRRVLLLFEKVRPAFAETVLPWGPKIRYRPQETIGQTLWQMGVFELGVSEAVWRLLDPGDFTLDIGANIGYMTSVMAARVGPTGSVTCFEPHPDLFEELMVNVNRWQSDAALGRIVAHQVALSDRVGTAVLNIPEDFAYNRGTAWISADRAVLDTESRRCEVETKRLDELIDLPDQIGLIKMDVQGHEIRVLEGGAQLLERHRVRDILFEEEGEYPTPATDFLQARGYTLFRLGQAFSGPVIRSVSEPILPPRQDTRNYLAPIDVPRAQARLQKKGWMVLRAAR